MRKQVLIAALIAFSSVAFAAYVGTRSGRTFDGTLATESEAVAATKRYLPAEATRWHVQTVALVTKASDISVGNNVFPAEGLTPRGFPGPVWVVVVNATTACNGRPEIVRLVYIFEAQNGRPVIVSGLRCGPPLLEPDST